MNAEITTNERLSFKRNRKAFLALFLNLAFRKKYGLAIYWLPKAEEFMLIIDTNPSDITQALDLERSEPGFAISPFNNFKNQCAYFLKAHITYSSQEEDLVFHKDVAYHVKQDILAFIKHPEKHAYPYQYFISTQTNPTTSKIEFTESVSKGVEKIKAGKLDKVVPSRVKSLQLENNFELVEAYFKAWQLFPNALVSLVSTPQTGTWMGATPEILISVIDRRWFHTVALAGTQAVAPNFPLKEVAWKQKEIEEQAFVSRYIINCLKKIRLREFEERGPRTVRSGDLAHLKSSFAIDMEATNFLHLGTVMLNLLHPTSAVCGMPEESAGVFLANEEKHDRKLFTGYLGPVNIKNDTYLFVNLRCAEIFEKQALIYAGAGVTADSCPEEEWFETELKCLNVAKILNSKTTRFFD